MLADSGVRSGLTPPRKATRLLNPHPCIRVLKITVAYQPNQLYLLTLPQAYPQIMSTQQPASDLLVLSHLLNWLVITVMQLLFEEFFPAFIFCAKSIIKHIGTPVPPPSRQRSDKFPHMILRRKYEKFALIICL